MAFWRSEFAPNTPPDAFDKQYAYGVRFNYGKEGKRTDYTPYSCLKIISSNPAPVSGLESAVIIGKSLAGVATCSPPRQLFATMPVALSLQSFIRELSTCCILVVRFFATLERLERQPSEFSWQPVQTVTGALFERALTRMCERTPNQFKSSLDVCRQTFTAAPTRLFQPGSWRPPSPSCGWRLIRRSRSWRRPKPATTSWPAP